MNPFHLPLRAVLLLCARGLTIAGMCAIPLAGPVLHAEKPTLPQWPAMDATCKPWAIHWWMGSAVDHENLTRELTRYRDAGLGGVNIVPIYGAKGAESRYIEYLSPKWLEMLGFTVDEARRLGLGVDMTTGSGWCFGGPGVSLEMGGQSISLSESGVKIRPSNRRVKRAGPGGEGWMINPLHGDSMRGYLQHFGDKFDQLPEDLRPRGMYHDSYEYNDAQWSQDFLQEFVSRRGYRLQDFWPAFAGKGDPETVARVRADYRETVSDLMVEKVFPQWTGWSHSRHMLTRFQAHGSPANLLDLYALASIPETEMFGRGRRDALHSGYHSEFSEGDRNVLIAKFASSAAHLSGKSLTSAETATWMAEHFCGTLEETKCVADLMFVAGVNHIFYHGTCYSPDDAAWPGWLFYASIQMNPRNSIWRDSPILNSYIARSQAVLQSGEPDSDVLLYWPIHDRWHHTECGLPEMFTVHSPQWLNSEPIHDVARELWIRGVGFDYVSDRLLKTAEVTQTGGVAIGSTRARAIVIPPTTHMPLETLELLTKLSKQGAKVLFVDHLPRDVPGLGHLEDRRAAFAKLLAGKQVPEAGPLEALLEQARVIGEGVCAHKGAMMIRRRMPDGHYRFVVNHGAERMKGWFSLASPAKSVAVMDPMSGQSGVARIRIEPNGTVCVYLDLEPGHSIILRSYNDRVVGGEIWRWCTPVQNPTVLDGPWDVSFIAGGPVLPKPWKATCLESWTRNGDPKAERFAGTALYRNTFDLPSHSDDARVLDLGTVKHSARVTLNGRSLGTLIMAPYRLAIPPNLLKPENNILEIEVTNLSANRIRDLDRRKVPWRIFHDTNVVNIQYKPFDASNWPLMDSGLIGAVRIGE